MAKIDSLSEEIGWLKLWLIILVVNIFAFVTWGIFNLDVTSHFLLILDVVAVCILMFIVYFINARVIKKIRKLKDL